MKNQSKRLTDHATRLTRKKSFTLVELLVVIVVIGILFSVLISRVDFAADDARATGAMADLRAYQTSASVVSLAYNGFSDDLDTLADQLNSKLDSELHFFVVDDHLESKAKDPWGTPYECWYISAENLSINGGEDPGLQIDKDPNLTYLVPETETSDSPISYRGGIAIFSAGSNMKMGINCKFENGTVVFTKSHGDTENALDDMAIVMVSVSSGGKTEVLEYQFGFEGSKTELVEEHIPGPSATCTTPQTCTDCGAVIKPATGHDYNVVNSGEGVYTYTCKVCGHSYRMYAWFCCYMHNTPDMYGLWKSSYCSSWSQLHSYCNRCYMYGTRLHNPHLYEMR